MPQSAHPHATSARPRGIKTPIRNPPDPTPAPLARAESERLSGRNGAEEQVHATTNHDRCAGRYDSSERPACAGGGRCSVDLAETRRASQYNASAANATHGCAEEAHQGPHFLPGKLG